MTTSFEYKGHTVEIGADNLEIKKGAKWKPWVKIDGVRQVIPDADAEEFSSKEVALIYAKAKAEKMIDAEAFFKPAKSEARAKGPLKQPQK